jgi:hypothetical protein
MNKDDFIEGQASNELVALYVWAKDRSLDMSLPSGALGRGVYHEGERARMGSVAAARGVGEDGKRSCPRTGRPMKRRMTARA